MNGLVNKLEGCNLEKNYSLLLSLPQRLKCRQTRSSSYCVSVCFCKVIRWKAFTRKSDDWCFIAWGNPEFVFNYGQSPWQILHRGKKVFNYSICNLGFDLFVYNPLRDSEKEKKIDGKKDFRGLTKTLSQKAFKDNIITLNNNRKKTGDKKGVFTLVGLWLWLWDMTPS